MERITITEPTPIERRACLVCAVEVRTIYGVDKIYPANRTAELFASLAGTKTLTSADIMTIEALGFGIANVTKKELPR